MKTDKFNQIVISHYGFQYPLGGLAVVVTLYPFRRSVSLYFGDYFRDSYSVKCLKTAVRTAVRAVIPKLLQKSPYRTTVVLVPSDHWSMATFRDLGYKVVHTRVRGWVLRKAKQVFASKVARRIPDLPVRRTRKGRIILPPVGQTLDWALDVAQRLTYVKLGMARWYREVIQRCPDLEHKLVVLNDMDLTTEDAYEGKHRSTAFV